MITLLDKTYDGESIVDSTRDFSEAFDERFTPANAKIPQDSHGFAQGVYRVSVTWSNQEIPDFRQQAKLAAIKTVPAGSAKVVFLLARLVYMVGAMRTFMNEHPELHEHPDLLDHVRFGAHLLGQLEGGAIEASQVKFEGMLDD